MPESTARVPLLGQHVIAIADSPPVLHRTSTTISRQPSGALRSRKVLAIIVVRLVLAAPNPVILLISLSQADPHMLATATARQAINTMGFVAWILSRIVTASMREPERATDVDLIDVIEFLVVMGSDVCCIFLINQTVKASLYELMLVGIILVLLLASSQATIRSVMAYQKENFSEYAEMAVYIASRRGLLMVGGHFFS